MKRIFGILMLVFVFNGVAQNIKSRTATLNIQTSALCEMCKNRLEEKLNYTKGIVFADLNLDNKVVTIKYKTKLITADQIRVIISKIGYHADDVERIKESFDALPGCCRDKNATCIKKK